jgi:hypothetical protein
MLIVQVLYIREEHDHQITGKMLIIGFSGTWSQPRPSVSGSPRGHPVAEKLSRSEIGADFQGVFSTQNGQT